ncbi:isochorismatase family cysteine hydrolase [Chloroflexota bacterium]
MADVILVVDMIRGFFEKKFPLYVGDECLGIIPNIRHLLNNGKASGSDIIFLCDCHAPDDLEFKMFPSHCIGGTEEVEIIPGLSEYPGDIIYKQRYSGFFETSLEEKLKAIQPEKLIVCGVATNICVMHTVADARNRYYIVEVPVDCVASFDPEAHQFALNHMEKVLGAKLTDSKD